MINQKENDVIDFKESGKAKQGTMGSLCLLVYERCDSYKSIMKVYEALAIELAKNGFLIPSDSPPIFHRRLGHEPFAFYFRALMPPREIPAVQGVLIDEPEKAADNDQYKEAA